VLGVITGFFVDFLFRFKPSFIRYKEIHSMCESEHCGCDEGIFLPAVKHTLKIVLFIFIVSFVLNLLIAWGGEQWLSEFMTERTVLGPVLAGIVGLIPNCASSVIITQLYSSHILGLGTMMSGLLVGAGVGLLVLFRTNKNWKENLAILGILYVSGVFWGILLNGLA
jgi:hypothetical protein